MNRKSKIIVAVLAAGLILAFFGWRSRRQEGETPDKRGGFYVTPGERPKTDESQPGAEKAPEPEGIRSPVGVRGPETIQWGETKITGTPMKIIAAERPGETGIKTAETLLKILGMEKAAKIADNDDVVMWEEEGGERVLDLNKKTGGLKYGKNLLYSPPEEAKVKLPGERLTEALLKLLGDLGIREEEIRIAGIEYEKVMGPRFGSSTIEEGRVVKIEADYVAGGLPVYTAAGRAVTARYLRDGEAVNLSISLLPKLTVTKEVAEVKAEETIKTSELKNFTVINISGGLGYDLGAAPAEIGSVNITKSYQGYWYEAEKERLIPYFFFEGNTMLAGGPANIILGLPAVKGEGSAKKDGLE